jgi:hypothetical protein
MYYLWFACTERMVSIRETVSSAQWKGILNQSPYFQNGCRTHSAKEAEVRINDSSFSCRSERLLQSCCMVKNMKNFVPVFCWRLSIVSGIFNTTFQDLVLTNLQVISCHAERSFVFIYKINGTGSDQTRDLLTIKLVRLWPGYIRQWIMSTYWYSESTTFRESRSPFGAVFMHRKSFTVFRILHYDRGTYSVLQKIRHFKPNNTKAFSQEKLSLPYMFADKAGTVKHNFLKMTVFWVVGPCSLVEVYRRFKGACCLYHQGDPDNGGCKHLWIVAKLLLDYTAQQPRRQPCSYSPSWEPSIFTILFF